MADLAEHVGFVTGRRGVPVVISFTPGIVRLEAKGLCELGLEEAETFAQLFVRACWLAGQQDT